MIESSLIEQGKRTSLMSVLLAVLLILGYAPLARFYRNRWEGWLLALGWVAVGVNLLRAALGHLYRMDRLPFRRFDLSLESDRVHPGGSFRLEMACQARRQVVLDEVAMTLECINRSLTERGRTERVLHCDRQVMAENVVLSSGAGWRLSAVLPVPASGPASYQDPQRGVRWRILMTARVRSWGELRDEFEVGVAPR